ncbi:MAG: DUF799 domain-containing protein [Oligoflexia bacterium]|nr:DUF799 domain-containing protein [Oligoflexia bacterium]
MKIFRFLFIFALCSCSTKVNQVLNFNPGEPLRVAVMPFAFVDSKGEFAEPDSSLLIDDVELVSSHPAANPAQFAYMTTLRELAKTGLDIVPASAVEAKLLHSGFGRQDLSFEVPKIFATSAQDICQKLLSCDAVLFGKVTEWDRSYYAIQSVNSVGLSLELRSARDGSVLFTSSIEDSESRGLTKGPTGFSDLVLEPIKGLDSKIIAELATRSIETALNPLRIDKRPEYLQTSPPAIYASAHTLPSGRLGSANSLKVLMFGSPNMQARFSIGDAVEQIPMVERDEGHYIGEFFPLAADSFKDQQVYVYLTDTYGRTSKQRLGNTPITIQH